MSGPLMLGLGGTLEHEFTCSRAGCGDAATWKLLWRNPKIHEEGRQKTWLACNAHIEFLRDFLAARSFPLSIEPIVVSTPDSGSDDA